MSASEVIEKVLTDNFETGFTDGFHWGGADGLAEFLDARSVFFDESPDVLQLMDLTRPDEHNIQARTRLWFFLREASTGGRTERRIHRTGVAHLAAPARTV